MSNGIVKDLTGMEFGWLRVVERAGDYITPKGKKYVCWKCKCKCGNETIVRGSGLKGGGTKSCGCYKKYINRKVKGINKYVHENGYVIGYTSNTGNPFYIDEEDFDRISIYYWNENSNGYARTFVNGKEVLMHRYVLKIEDTNIHVDHQYHNNMDNRKRMLRATTCHNNTMNKKLATNNTSGITGVSWEEKSNKWHSYIWFKGKTIHLGRFKDFNEAVRERKIAEEKYFGEFSYTNSMKVEGQINEI